MAGLGWAEPVLGPGGTGQMDLPGLDTAAIVVCLSCPHKDPSHWPAHLPSARRSAGTVHASIWELRLSKYLELALHSLAQGLRYLEGLRRRGSGLPEAERGPPHVSPAFSAQSPLPSFFSQLGTPPPPRWLTPLVLHKLE